ncbi:hypothetical protein D030_3389A, partial [Vibrio parahaemolyticus AQ3810]
MRFS